MFFLFLFQFHAAIFNVLSFLPLSRVCKNYCGTQSTPRSLCDYREVVVKRKPPGKCTRGDTKIILISVFLLPLSFCVFVLRLLESSLLSAEVKEGEILPPTIQRLMKGYNKYLRPFFDSKETADTCSHGNDKSTQGKSVFDREREGYILQFCACMHLLSNIR